MVKCQRDLSQLAESDGNIIYNAAFNQWGEGQVLEATISGTPVHPGKPGMMYMEITRDILGSD